MNRLAQLTVHVVAAGHVVEGPDGARAVVDHFSAIRRGGELFMTQANYDALKAHVAAGGTLPFDRLH